MITPSLTADLLILLIVTLIIGHTIKLFMQKRWLAFDPLNSFWGGALFCYVLQPLADGALFMSWHKDGIIEASLFWVLFGLVFVIAGYESRVGVSWAEKAPAMPMRLVSVRVTMAAFSLIGLGIVGYAYLFASAGSLGQWLSVGRGGTNYLTISSGYLGQLPQLLGLGVVLLLFDAEFHHIRGARRLLSWALGFLMWLWYVYEGTRSNTIGFAAILLAVWYLPRRRNPPIWLLVLGFFTLLTLANFQGLYRTRFTDLSFNLDKIDMEKATTEVLPAWMTGREGAPVRAARGAEFNCLMTIVELVPDPIDYNYGRGYLEFVTRPIPRAIWPDKIYPALETAYPILNQGRLATSVVPTAKKRLLMGPSFTYVGQWYAVGGAVALVLAGLLTGCLFRAIRTIYDRVPGNEGDIILFSTLFMIGFGEACSTPLYFLFTLPFVVAPLIVALRLCAGGRTAAGAGLME